MIGEILSLVGDVVNWASSSSSNKQTQEQLDAIKRRNIIPSALIRALGLAEEGSTYGFAGEPAMEAEMKTELPTTLNQFRDMGTSGQLTDVLTHLYTKQNAALTNLRFADKQEQERKKEVLQNLLSGAVSNAQETKTSTDMNIDLEKAMLGQQKTRDSMSYLNQILGTAGKLGDTDWSNLLSGFSKPAQPGTQDNTSSTSNNYTPDTQDGRYGSGLGSDDQIKTLLDQLYGR